MEQVSPPFLHPTAAIVQQSGWVLGWNTEVGNTFGSHPGGGDTVGDGEGLATGRGKVPDWKASQVAVIEKN